MIFLLLTIPIDSDRLTEQDLSGKNGNYTCFSQRILPRAINIAISQDGKIQPIRTLPESKIKFAGHFGHSIGRFGALDRIYIYRHLFGSSVGSSRGGKDDLTHAKLAGNLQ